MAKRERPRFIPPSLGKRDQVRVTSSPRWLIREAAQAFGLGPYELVVFQIIADNLDETGASRTAIALIAERGGMSRNAAAKAVDRLIHHHLLFELAPRQKGHIMLYGIPPEIPWYPR
jgi:hypothetical protein